MQLQAYHCYGTRCYGVEEAGAATAHSAKQPRGNSATGKGGSEPLTSPDVPWVPNSMVPEACSSTSQPGLSSYPKLGRCSKAPLHTRYTGDKQGHHHPIDQRQVMSCRCPKPYLRSGRWTKSRVIAFPVEPFSGPLWTTPTTNYCTHMQLPMPWLEHRALFCARQRN